MKAGTILSIMAICEKNILRYILLSITLVLGLDKEIELIVISTYTILFLLYLKKRDFKISNCIKEIMVLLFFVLSILGSIIIYPENSRYILEENNFWNTIFPCLRYFFIGLIFVPDRYTMNLMGKVSCWAILVEITFVILYMMPRGLLKADDMSRAYQILPNVLFVINYFMNEKTKISAIVSILGLVYILGMGTRGPLIIVITYFILKLLKEFNVSLRKIALIIPLIGLLMLTKPIFVNILKIIQENFMNWGISTRIIDLFLADEVITHMSGRDEIYEIAFKKIMENPWFGYGVYGEWEWFNWSVHNMYLEIIIHYGIIIGIIILISLFILVFESYYITKNEDAKDFILIWGTLVFVRGIFGGSYLNYSFFILIAFCMREWHRISIQEYIN